MMQQPSFGELIGAAMALVAMGVLAFLALSTGNQEAAGALIAVVAAATGYFLRAKVQAPKR